MIKPMTDCAESYQGVVCSMCKLAFVDQHALEPGKPPCRCSTDHGRTPSFPFAKIEIGILLNYHSLLLSQGDHHTLPPSDRMASLGSSCPPNFSSRREDRVITAGLRVRTVYNSDPRH